MACKFILRFMGFSGFPEFPWSLLTSAVGLADMQRKAHGNVALPKATMECAIHGNLPVIATFHETKNM